MPLWENVFDVTSESTDLHAHAWAHRSGSLAPAGISIFLVDNETNRDYTIVLALKDVVNLFGRSVRLLEDAAEARAQ